MNEKSNTLPSSLKRIFREVDLSTKDKYKRYIEGILEDTNNIVGKEIKEYIIKKALTYYRLKYHYLTVLNNENQLTKAEMKKIYISIIHLNVFIMDAYFLSRIFKEFKTESNGHNKSKLFERKPKNIVTYTGNEHARTLRTFLTKQGFEETTVIENYKNYDRCIDLSFLKEQWFE